MFPIPWNYPFRKKDGTVVNMEDAGGGGGGGYVLPPATESTLGGIKVGDGLSVEADGTLSASGGGGGGMRVSRYNLISAYAAGTDVYIGGNSLATYGMLEGEKLVAVVGASGHFSHGIQCSTNSSGAGKKFSEMVATDTVFLHADLKYNVSASSPGEICFIFEST